jgi:DNA-binding LytR/AlgR family response regulator
MIEPQICVLIIDSDKDSMKQTVTLFQENPLIKSIEGVDNSDDALLKVIALNPHIVFIEFPVKGNSGDQLFSYLNKRLPGTTLAYIAETKDYAYKAIQDGVFNYFLKPVIKENIKKIVQEVQLSIQTNIQSRINQIIEKIPEEIKLKLQTTKGYLLINPDEILYCKADGFYSELYLTDNRMELCYLLLAKIEKILVRYNFLRVSRSYVINMKYIRKIYRSSNTIVLSADGKEYEVKGSKLQIRNLSKLENT